MPSPREARTAIFASGADPHLADSLEKSTGTAKLVLTDEPILLRRAGAEVAGKRGRAHGAVVASRIAGPGVRSTGVSSSIRCASAVSSRSARSRPAAIMPPAPTRAGPAHARGSA